MRNSNCKMQDEIIKLTILEISKRSSYDEKEKIGEIYKKICS